MSKTNYDYIQFANYKDIPNWSVQYVVEEQLGFTKKYPMAKIGSFLKRSKNLVEIQDNVEYKRVSISTIGKGVTVRDTKRGINIGTKKQYIIRKGQFLVSKIDARNGAFGVVPEEADGAIITGNFWAFDVDFNKIAPQYLVLVTQTNQFVSFVEKCSNGTTNRHYLQEDAFLQQAIPLPSLEEQRKILAEYNRANGNIIECENIIYSIAVNEQKKFEDFLKIRKNINKNPTSSLRFISYQSTILRWDSFAVNQSINSVFPIKKLGEFIKNIATGTTPSTSKKAYFGGDVKFYTPADVGNGMYLASSERTISDLAIKEKKARLFHKNDLLFVGIGSTVGKIGIVSDEIVSSNQQITGFTIDENMLDVQYLYYYLKFNKDISIADQSKTTLPIVNQEKIKQIPIVVPSVELQRKIVNEINEMEEKVVACRNQICILKNATTKKFEQTIFE